MRINLDLESHTNAPVFEAILEPPANVLERSAQRAESDIKLLFTKKNRVAVQDIAIQTLTEPIDAEVIAQLNLKWTDPPILKVICARLGCLPDPDCRFTWLRVSFELGRELSDPALRPLACRLYPSDEQDKIKMVRGFEISNKLNFKILEVETPELSRKDSSEKEFDSFQYRVTTFGKMGPNPAWDFRATDVHPEITGDFTLMVATALKPGISTQGEISISAQVQLRSSPFSIPLIMKRTSEGVIKNSFPLSGTPL